MDIFDMDFFDYDAMESADYEEDVFDYDDYAMEANTAAKVAIAGAFDPYIMGIYDAIHRAKINRSHVISASAMQAHGAPADVAKKEAKKAVTFFVSKGFLPDGYKKANTTEISYNELTPYGKEYVDGFYDAIDDVTPISLKKAVYAKQSANDWNSGSAWGLAWSIIHVFLSLMVVGMTDGLFGGFALIMSSVNLASYVKQTRSKQMFQGTYVDPDA